MDKNAEIPLEKRVECFLVAANIFKITIAPKVAESMLKCYDIICEKGGKITVDEILELRDEVEIDIKERIAKEKREANKNKTILKVGLEEPTWIEKNIIDLHKKGSSKK